MIIDFHTHTFPDKIAARALETLGRNSHQIPVGDGTTEGLIRAMREGGVTQSVVLPVATAERQVVHINDSAISQNETLQKEGVLSFGAMHPMFSGVREELARIKERGIIGIKLHPVFQGVDFDAPEYLRILSCAAELGLIVVTHGGDDIGFPGVVHVTPKMALRALKEIGASPSRKIADGSFKLILAHMGGWRNWDEVKELGPDLIAAGPVMLDTSYSTGHFIPNDDGYWDGKSTDMLSREDFCQIVRIFGAKRVVFGTDWPWSSPAEAVRNIREFGLTGEEVDRILYKNAAALLG